MALNKNHDQVSLEGVKKIAFLMSPRLGDCLISMVISHNLRCNGFEVTSYSNFLTAIKSYFPEEDIQPYPNTTDGAQILKSFDLLIYMFPHNIGPESNRNDPRIIVLDEYTIFRRLINMVDVQVAVCREMFHLKNVVRTNGLKLPADLAFRKHAQRVIIHPSASSKEKQWTEQGFIKLARELQKNHFEPVFTIAATEKDQFAWIFNEGLSCIAEPSITLLTRYLGESGWFIGNDSGIGHLASNLGIPTLTLVARRKVKIRWRPTWAPGEVIRPRIPLIFHSWKMRYWKYFISVSCVLNTFLRLTRVSPHN